jgi:hypothetical protein
VIQFRIVELTFSRIRPLLTQDIKIRRVSGRMQISTDGKHLVDGVAWGRPLLRKAGDRPAVNIPPRKRQRIEHNKDDEDPEGFQTLKEKEAEDSEEDNNKQLILHADFEDDDEEDDEDFAPGEDEDAEEDGESEEDLEGDNEKKEAENGEEPPVDSHANAEATDDFNEPALADVKDQVTRAKIRKLHSAFPKSPLAVCKYVFNGSEDIGEAYEAMARGFVPEKPKSAVTEISQGVNQGDLTVPKTRSMAKTLSMHESENLASMQVEPEENTLLDYYDQNGLPPGFIKSGKALSVMAAVLKSSPTRPRSESRRSASVTSNKGVRFALDENSSKGLTSTLFIDKESQVEEEESEEESDDGSSESDDEDASSSSEDSSDSSDEEAEGGKGSNGGTSSSESGSERSSDSSSDDDEASGETSSKQETPIDAPANLNTTSPSQDNKSKKIPSAAPGQGSTQTHTRNQRRRNADALDRFKKKGILPAETTIADFRDLAIDETTSAETALAALEAVRAARSLRQSSERKDQSVSQGLEFEHRRQELLASLAVGGVEVDPEFSRNVHQSPPTESGPDVEMTGVEESAGESLESQQAVETQQSVELHSSAELQREQSIEPRQVVELQAVVSQEVANPASIAVDQIEHTSTPPPNNGAEVEMARPSTAPEMAAVDTPSTSPKPPPSSTESRQPSSSRRSKLDLGAGKRLLFSALGVRAPKTKKDEEKVRNNLMKGVRPLVPKKPTEDPQPDPIDETAAEDLDAWRKKIIYRAVECIQDAVDLSEPPFPFEQRWDPQQRGPYRGDRGGKRKKDQRDQAQYYQDDTRASKKQKRRKGKHNYAEEEEYIHASYEPSFRDDTMISQFDDPIQPKRLQSDDVEGEISQQLMNDIQTPTAGFSQGPEDLAFLPDDPSILPDLNDGQAKVGMTIAFKQLEVSEATKWQPQISAYRTTIVIAIAESGELQLTLAMRDRQQPNKRYDPQTGERIYSNFEIPDDDEMDDEDNKGMLNLLFNELIQPKIVQEPPPNIGGDVVMDESSQTKELTSFDTVTLSHEQKPAGDAEEAQLSHVTETFLNSDAPEPHQPEKNMLDAPAEPPTPSAESQLRDSMVDALAEPMSKNTPANDSILEPNTPWAELQENHTSAIDNLAEDISEEGRQNWAHLMREEGGFHSSVPSSLTKVVRPDGMRSPDELKKLAQDMDMSGTPLERPYSPRFNGLGSSPTRKPRGTSKSPEKDEREDSPPAPPQSSWETVDELANPPPQVSGQPQESPSSPLTSAALKTTQAESGKKAPTRTLPPSKGLQAWQALQQRKRSPTPASDVENSKTSPGPGLSLGLDGADERESIASVRYPGLSVGSSFTSQVADHGRQPDFDFEDTLNLSADRPNAGGLDFYKLSHDPQPDVESEAARSATPKEATNSSSVEIDMSDVDEPELPPRESDNEYKAPQRNSPEILEDDPSSDESVLPTIEKMASSQKAMKRETATPTKSLKKDARHKKAVEALDDDVFEDYQTTPTQKQGSFSGNRPSKGRNSEKPAYQPRASIPRASRPRPSQSQPQASQIVDLTMSSDIEAEPESEPDKAVRRPSKRYDDGDDDSYEDDDPKTGWIPKKHSNVRGAETRRHTSVGLRPSSQASLNTQNRRKTSAR